MPAHRVILDINTAAIVANSRGALIDIGYTVPADGTGGHAVGGLFLATGPFAGLYINRGTAAACQFVQMDWPKSLVLADVGLASQTLANGNTVTLPSGYIKNVTNAGAVTGIIMADGDVVGRTVRVVNRGTGNVTFAAAGTSKVAMGTSGVIIPGASFTLTWDGTNWYA